MSHFLQPPHRQAAYYWVRLYGLWTVARRSPHVSGTCWEVVGTTWFVHEGAGDRESPLV